MTQTASLTRIEKANASLNVPPGVTGHQRRMFLTLTDEQKRIYRHHWFLFGRLAAHCYDKAVAETYEW